MTQPTTPPLPATAAPIPPPPTAVQWKEAINHLYHTMQIYTDMLDDPGVNTALAIEFTFIPLLRRYLMRDRSRELFDAIMDIE